MDILSYRSIQELNNKWRGISTIQIQSGYLGEELSTDKIDDITKLRNVDLFLECQISNNLAKINLLKRLKMLAYYHLKSGFLIIKLHVI